MSAFIVSGLGGVVVVTQDDGTIAA